MLHYLTRRLLLGVLTLLLITFVIYALIRNMPGTPLTANFAETNPERKLNPADVKRMEKAYGLDKPVHVAYFQWLGNILQLDLGRSISRKQPVSKLILERVGPTLMLSMTSIFLAYVISLPIGLTSTVRSGHWDERITGMTLYILYSFPSFVAALFMQVIFAVRLGWLPLLGMTSDNYADLTFLGKCWDVFLHALMPVACMTYGSLAYDSRFVKANLEEVVRQDYIRTARAKGVPRDKIMTRHALRNTLIPLVTQLGLAIPTLLSGAVILEQIFTWPGMGLLFFESLESRDYPTIMGLTLMFSMLTLVGQLVADVLYAIVDPRVSYS